MNDSIRKPYELSLLQVPVGTLSDNGSACVGRGGHMFLVKGTNDLLQQYEVPDSDEGVQKDCRDWATLVEMRYEEISRLNARFLQFFIPEKNSALSELLPMEFRAPSAWYRGVLQNLKSSSVPETAVLDGLKVIENSGRARDIYRKMDTHFSPFGAICMVNAVLAKLGETAVLPSDVSRPDTQGCDLGPKLLKAMRREQVLNIGIEEAREMSKGLERITWKIPDGGGHTGMHCVFRRENAPIDKKVIVFGNSFFERGDFTSSLSWWFARLFKEFHFLWSASVDLDYVKQNNPDIVIAQSIERFLPVLPKR